MAAQTDVVITMLPSPPHVREVYTGPNGLLQTAKPDSLLIDCSTIGPATAREVAAAAAAKNVLAADAPVSGGTLGAHPTQAMRSLRVLMPHTFPDSLFAALASQASAAPRRRR